MRLVLLLCLLGHLSSFAFGQSEHRVEVTVSGYDDEILVLANNILDKQYIVDTAYRQDDGAYVFSSDTAALPQGIYLVVLQPDNDYFQILMGEDQTFNIQADAADLANIRVSGDAENQLFVDYLGFLGEVSEKGEPYRATLQDSTASETDKAAAQEKVDAIGDEVLAYQLKLMRDNPESFTAAIIRTNQPNDPPPFDDLDPEARNEAQFRWLQRRYFDMVDLKDDRLLRTPFLVGRIDYFTDKLHVQMPDSVAAAMDQVLDRMDPTSELFKHYVVHFTNKAARSNIVGMDAVYVHMVDNYYANGKAYWADADQLDKMVDNANKTRPLLIGKTAPDITMKTRSGETVTLHGVDANFTILYFWSYDCGHCKKSTPVMQEFYEKWKDRGVEIFSICTKQNTIEKCWEYVDEKEIGDWMHVTDRYMRYYKQYEITSTPTIFVLDKDKVIASKRIGAEQLDDLLTALEAREENLKSQGK